LPPIKAPLDQAHNALRYQRQATIKLIQERQGASSSATSPETKRLLRVRLTAAG
jgi:hypothetical protein